MPYFRRFFFYEFDVFIKISVKFARSFYAFLPKISAILLEPSRIYFIVANLSILTTASWVLLFSSKNIPAGPKTTCVFEEMSVSTLLPSMPLLLSFVRIFGKIFAISGGSFAARPIRCTLRYPAFCLKRIFDCRRDSRVYRLFRARFFRHAPSAFARSSHQLYLAQQLHVL